MNVEAYASWALADARKIATVLKSVREGVVQAEEYCNEVQPIVDFSIASLENLKDILKPQPYVSTDVESAMYRYVDSVRVRINELRYELGAP